MAASASLSWGNAFSTRFHATIACSTCHTAYTTSLDGGTPANCATGCHQPGSWTTDQLTKVKTNDATAGCGAVAAGVACHGRIHAGATKTTCVNCHGVTASTTDVGQSAHHKTNVTDVTVKALVTIKINTTKFTLGKKVTVSGFAKSTVAGYKVKVLIQKKNSAGVFKTLTSKTVTSNGSTWSLIYKPLKKGAYRFQASTATVAGTNGNAVAIPAKKTGYSKTLTVK